MLPIKQLYKGNALTILGIYPRVKRLGQNFDILPLPSYPLLHVTLHCCLSPTAPMKWLQGRHPRSSESIWLFSYVIPTSIGFVFPHLASFQVRPPASISSTLVFFPLALIQGLQQQPTLSWNRSLP